MAVYWTTCFLSVAVALFLQEKRLLHNRRGKVVHFSVFLIGFPLFFISAIRYDVGTDYWSYLNIFEKIQYGMPTGVEPLYLLLNKVVAYLFGDYRGVLILTSAIFVYFIMEEVVRQSQNIPLSIFLILGSLQYFSSFSNIRQQLGIAILFFSIRYVEKNNFKKFLICIIAASMMHISCALFIVVYFLKNRKISITKGFIITAIIIASRLFLSKFIRWVLSYTIFVSYLGSKYDTNETSYATMLVQFGVLILAILFRNSKDNFYDLKLNMQYLAFWISLLSGVVPQVHRVYRIFGIIAILLIPSALSSIKNKNQRLIVIFVIVVLYFIYVNITIGLNNQVNAVPYKTIFGIN